MAQTNPLDEASPIADREKSKGPGRPSDPERDRWTYEQKTEGHSAGEILEIYKAIRAFRGWTKIGDESGIRHAIKRHRDLHGIPVVRMTKSPGRRDNTPPQA